MSVDENKKKIVTDDGAGQGKAAGSEGTTASGGSEAAAMQQPTQPSGTAKGTAGNGGLANGTADNSGTVAQDGADVTGTHGSDAPVGAAATATQTTGSGPDSATQTTGNTAATQTAGAATQNTDAQQAAGGVDNIGVSSPQQAVSGLPNFQIQYFAPGKDGELVAPTLKMTPGQQAPMAGPGDMPLPQSQSSDDAAASAIEDKSRQFTMNSRVVGQHLADWAKTRFLDAVKNGDKSIAAYMDDYNKWARENGKEPLDVLTMYEAMKDRDITKSYGQNTKESKKLQRQQRWEQIGNLLMHLGNFVGAVAGGPTAKYESGEDLTKRQQAVKDAVLKQNGDPKNILAEIWKERADKRKEELNVANRLLIGTKQATEEARKAKIEGDTANAKAQSDANVALKGAQKEQSESAKKQNDANTELINERTQTERTLRPFRKAYIQSGTRARNASANASNASAKRSLAAANKEQSETYQFPAMDENGRLHYFSTKAAADNYAQQHGTYEFNYATSETTDNTGGKKSTRAPHGGHARISSSKKKINGFGGKKKIKGFGGH